jgi:hypothetical protein
VFASWLSDCVGVLLPLMQSRGERSICQPGDVIVFAIGMGGGGGIVKPLTKDVAVGNDNDNVDDELYAKYANNAATRSYEYYKAAAEEIVPSYKVEPAKSAWSNCAKYKKLIDEGGVCVGWHDKLIGVYRVREVSLARHSFLHSTQGMESS